MVLLIGMLVGCATWWDKVEDYDGDGHGSSSYTETACLEPTGFAGGGMPRTEAEPQRRQADLAEQMNTFLRIS